MNKDNSSSSTTDKKVGYNRCRKPLPTETKCSTKDLRKVSKVIVTIFNKRYTITPELTTDDRVCNACRKLLNEVCDSSQSDSPGKLFLLYSKK